MTRSSGNESNNKQPLLAPEASSDAMSWGMVYWRQWRLAIYTSLMLIASVGNTVYFKRMTSAMPNYGWYLTQLATVMYIPIFGILAGTSIAQAQKDLIKKFAVMGIFDGLAGTLMVLGGVQTSGTMQVLLSQSVIPITMLFSLVLTGKRYDFLQHVGATVMVAGIVLSNVASSKDAALDNPIFNVVFLLAMVPTAVSSVFKEVAFRGFEGDLDVNVLQFWVTMFQLVVNFAAMPIYTLRLLGPQQVPLSEMPELTIGGSRCLFLLEDYVKDSCGMPGERPCDHCRDAWLAVLLYLSFNLLYNLTTVLIIKHGSAALCFLVATLRMPLSSIAFGSTLIMGSEAVQPSVGDLTSLLVITIGLVLYRWGANRLSSKGAGLPTDSPTSPREDDGVQSPAQSPRSSGGSWFSPSDKTSKRHVRRRWSFVPLFTTGATPGLQPALVVVPANRPQPRSAERVRSDLIGKLGAASPLHSPKLRSLLPAESASGGSSPLGTPPCARHAAGRHAAGSLNQSQLPQTKVSTAAKDSTSEHDTAFSMSGLPAN